MPKLITLQALLSRMVLKQRGSTKAVSMQTLYGWLKRLGIEPSGRETGVTIEEGDRVLKAFKQRHK